MQVSGRDYQLLNDALVNAFGFNSLDAMLQFGLRERTDVIVGRGADLNTAVFQLIEEYNRRDQVEKLVQAARRFNPTNGQLHQVAQSLGRATQVTAFFADEEVPVAAGELEKLVRRRIPKLNSRETRQQMMRVEGQVCIVESRLPNGQGKAEGSGFLIGPDAVLTNYHVVRDFMPGDHAKKLQVRFDALLQEDGVREPDEGIVVAVDEIASVFGPYTPDDPFNKKKAPALNELDFAILLLDEEAGREPVGGAAGPMQTKTERGWIKMPVEERLFREHDPLIVYQYPGGRELLMAIDTDAVVEVVWDGMRLRYRNNTEGGSSGSPVFDMEWELVALHHSGGPGSPAAYNEGIPITRIRAYLESQQMLGLLGE
jgi:V8-like Glu-specific endopeptidase